MLEKLRNNINRINDKMNANIEKLNMIFKIAYLVHLCFCFTIFGAENGITTIPILFIAGILILYRFLNIKIYINYKNVKVLILFMISYVLSSLIYSRYGWGANFKCAVWMFIQFFVLYTFDITREKKNIIKEFKLVSIAIIIVTSIISLSSLGLMFCNCSSFYTAPNNEVYVMGIASWGRLYGIVTDPNYMSVLAATGILLSCYFIQTNKSKKIIFVNAVSIIIQSLFIAFAGSRTALVSLIIGVATYVFLTIIKEKKVRKIIKGIILGVAASVIIYVGINGLVEAYNWTRNKIENIGIQGTVEENGKENISIGREEMLTEDISNRRFDIWKSGLEIFKNSCFIGISFGNVVPYALESVPETYIVSNDFAIFDAFHNTVVDVFVSQGILGILIIGYFVVTILIDIVKYKMKENDIEDEKIINVLFSICVLIAVSAMFLSHVFYVNVPTTCVFWMTLGYLIVIIEKSKNNLKGR